MAECRERAPHGVREGEGAHTAELVSHEDTQAIVRKLAIEDGTCQQGVDPVLAQHGETHRLLVLAGLLHQFVQPRVRTHGPAVDGEQGVTHPQSRDTARIAQFSVQRGHPVECNHRRRTAHRHADRLPAQDDPALRGYPHVDTLDRQACKGQGDGAPPLGHQPQAVREPRDVYAAAIAVSEHLEILQFESVASRQGDAVRQRGQRAVLRRAEAGGKK